MPKKIIFAIVAMTLVSLTVSQLSCSEKAILDSNRRLIYNEKHDYIEHCPHPITSGLINHLLLSLVFSNL